MPKVYSTCTHSVKYPLYTTKKEMETKIEGKCVQPINIIYYLLFTLLVIRFRSGILIVWISEPLAAILISRVSAVKASM